MIRLLTALFMAALSLAAWSAPALAQGTATSLCIWSVNSISGQLGCLPVDGTNPLPVSASASISGWPGSTQTTGTPISVTTGGVTGTLPSGAVVVATNDGATNTAYCKLGASATTSDTPIYPHSSVSFTVGVATQLTCITSTSTTTVNMSGGAGLPTGWGGGSGGSGSNASVSATGAAVPASATYIGITSAGNLTGWNGAVTQATAANLNATVVGTGTFAVQAAIPTWAGGTLGAMANYGTTPGAVLVPGVNAFVTNAPASGAHNTANSPTTNLATDEAAIAAWGQGAIGSAAPTGGQYQAAVGSGATGGLGRNLINCDLHVFKHITSATDTLAVQGVASQTIYICGALANGAGTATAFLENTASANANCSSSNTQIAGNITSAAASASGFYNPIWGGLKNTSGNGLCINSTGTGGIDVDIWYAQF